MSVHEQFAEDLALYALGALEGSERFSLEKHLEECSSCRRELEQLRGDAALLALTTSGPRPPARAKSRLMDAVAREPKLESAKPRFHWWAALGWLAAAVMIVFAAGFWRQNTHLSSTVVKLSEMLERQRAESEQARRIADLLKAPDARGFEILPVSLKTPPPPAGKAIYSRERNGLIFTASNLLPLPTKKAYELWLIPAQGAPIPAGVFKPDAHGGAVIVNPPIPPGVEAKAFAITIEPEQGSTTPTMPIIMKGAGG
jgi:anti-sigma-K factor RskA